MRTSNDVRIRAARASGLHRCRFSEVQSERLRSQVATLVDRGTTGAAHGQRRESGGSIG
jgi:hypothetical protein